MMEITVSLQTIISFAAVITALGTVGGVALWCFRFVARQKAQDDELAAIRKEQTVICIGIRACLQGLKEQGCDGPVTDALDKLNKHLNSAAHEE